MDGLLHWDFSPGLRVEEQVHSRFGSTVHFVPNPNSKEFFLEVSFSSASFHLSEESVGLALQSCIGGLCDGFKVLRLGNRCFRFSVASNRVGHFIFGLRDRIWPDFVCHFHLHKGVNSTPPQIMGWHADAELNDLASSPGPTIKSKWLTNQSKDVINPASLSVFQNMGLAPPLMVRHSGKGSLPAITFGSFSGPDSQEDISRFRFGSINVSILPRSHVTLPSFRDIGFFTKFGMIFLRIRFSISLMDGKLDMITPTFSSWWVSLLYPQRNISMNGLSTALTVIGLVTGHQFVLVFSVKLVVIHLDRALVLH